MSTGASNLNSNTSKFASVISILVGSAANMADLLQGVQEGAVAGSGDIPQDFEMPSTEELLEAIEKMAGLSEDQKKELVDSILTRQQEGGDAGFPGLGSLPVVPPPAVNNFSLQMVWMLSLLSIVFLILGKNYICKSND